MPRDWQVACKECGATLLYSERSRADAVLRGQSPPERCGPCRAKHSRAISRLAVKYLDMEPGVPVPDSGLKAGRLSRLPRPPRPHSVRETGSFEPPSADEFGIQDEEIVQLLHELGDRQVAVIMAGTGSGKSTYLPWRLLVPPAPFPEDFLTRYGRIVVTQPRIEASTAIPRYVAEKLHASVAGPGTDIGYQNSKNRDQTDPRNKLVYLTDGTLVNMIRRGSLHDVSTVIIDEAHERSLNIDLILALLRRELHGLPHLKVLIVSATIDSDTFRDFFEPDFPVLVKTMRSKGSHPVLDRWYSGPELPLDSWPAQMPARAAQTVIEVLRWMAFDVRPPDVPQAVENYQGDLLVFLTGQRPIEAAIALTKELISDDDQLSEIEEQIELLPLYGELPPKKRDRPLNPKTRGKLSRFRVIFSTNLAETSLTIEGIRHVIDTGLINRTQWDPATASESIEQAPHSQHGLRQRRGRAGRTAPGVWHCLFTKAQFDGLERDTAPEISRAPLAAVILAAAVAGVADVRSLKWVAPGPPPGEVDRARSALRAVGAIDADGDPTPVGRELASTRASFDDAALLITADQVGCAVEAATVLAAKTDGKAGQMLRWSRQWPAAAKVHVDDVHSAILAGAVDDVDVVCRIWAGWEAQPNRQSQLDWAARHFVDPEVMSTIGRDRATLLEPLMAKTRSSGIRKLDLRLLSRLRAAIAWAHPNSWYLADRKVDERGICLVGKLEPVAGPRADAQVIEGMHAGSPPYLDDVSWVARHLPPGPTRLVLMNRQVRRQYLTPLAPPERVLNATFCVVLPDDLIRAGDDWLVCASTIPLDHAPPAPSAIPGDRFVARHSARDSALELLDQLEPAPDPTVDIEDPFDDDYWDDEPEPPESSTLESDVGGRSIPLGQTELEDAEFDGPEDDGAEEGNGNAAGHDDGPPGSRARPDARDLVARLEGTVLETHHGQFEVVVTGIDPDGTVICRPDTRDAELAEFIARNHGSEVVLTFDHLRVFSRDRQPVLIARHEASGLITPVDPSGLGTGLRYSQLRSVAPGTAWTFSVTASGMTPPMLEVAQTGRTVAALNRFAGDRAAFRTIAAVVDAFEDAIFVQVVPDGVRVLDSDPPLVFRISASDLPRTPERIRVGLTVSILCTWQKFKPFRVRAGALGQHSLPTGPYEVHGRHLVATAPLTVADWRRLHFLSEKIADPLDAYVFRARVHQLALGSHRGRIRVVDEQVATDALRDGSGTARVVSRADNGGIMVMTPLGEHYIGPREVAALERLGGTTAVNTSVAVYFSESRSVPGDVQVALFDPREQERLSIHGVVECVIGALTRSQKERHVLTTTGVPGLASLDALPPDIAEGDRMRLRVADVPQSDRPLRFSCRTERELLQVPRELAAVIPDRNGRKDLRAFERLAPEGCEIRLEASMTQLEVCHDGTHLARAAAKALRSALAGPVHVLSVPSHGPVRTNGQAVLRSAALLGGIIVDAEVASGRGRPDCELWVAAPDEAVADRVLAFLQSAYPQVWVSGWFKCYTAEWQAARQAAEPLPGRLRRETALDGSGKPIFKAVIACAPAELNDVVRAARAAWPAFPDGTWGADPAVKSRSVAVTRVTNPEPVSRDGVPPGKTPTGGIPSSTTSVQRTPARTAVGTGASVESAVEEGLQRLGLKSGQVTVRILRQPKRGFLGLMKVLAQVEVTENLS